MMCTSSSHLERLLIGAVALIMAGAAAALPLDAPIHIQADQVKVSQRMDKSVYTGQVVISQGPVTLHGDKLVVYRIHHDEIRAVLTGDPAHLRRQSPQEQPITGHAQRIVYNSAQDLVTLQGNAFLKQGGNTLSSNTIRYNLATATTTAGRSEDGRVRITLHPGTLDQAAAHTHGQDKTTKPGNSNATHGH